MLSRLIAAVLLVAAATVANGSPPIVFNYQAKLTDSEGAPLSGSHTLYFSIWEGGSAGAADSGAELYAESAVLSITDGIVNHAIGTGTQESSASLSPAMFQGDSSLYLQVAVGTPGNAVLPRTVLTMTPFAARALTADTATEAANGIPAGLLTISFTTAPVTGFTDTGLVLTGNWVRQRTLSPGRNIGAAAAANGKIYYIGGASGGYLGTNDEFDPVSQWWTSRLPLSPGRAGLTATEIDGIIYAVGGFTSGPTYYGNTDVYNPANNTWTPRQVLGKARQYHAAAAVDGKLYVAGGEIEPFVMTNTTEQYDPGTNLWTPRADMPTSRGLVASVGLDGYLYVIGGLTDGGVSALNERYNPATDTWEPLAPLPVPLHYTAAATAGGKIYIFGGVNELFLATLWTYVYDPATDTWETGPPLGTSQARAYHSGASLNGKIYAIGGSDPGSFVTMPEALNAGVFHVFVKD